MKAPQSGGLLRLPARPNFTTKDPYQGGAGSERSLKARPVYEPLVSFEFDHGVDYRIKGKVVPWLAEKWEQPAPNEYVFTLRKDVKWQDGREFTAEDVVYTVRRVQDPARQYRSAADWSGITGAVAEGKHQVRIVLKGPDPEFLLERLTDKHMLPKHLEAQGQELEKVAMGTGAFKMVTMDQTRGLSFEKNPNYWMPGLPYLDGIVVHKGLDDSAMIAAMSTGQLDAYNPDTPGTANQLKTLVPNLGLAEYFYNYSNTVFMHLDRPPFNDIRIRRALHLGLDRQKLIAIALDGKGALAATGIQPTSPDALPQAEMLKMPGFGPQSKEQDLREAKRLLAEAGQSRLKFKMAYAPNLSSSKAVAEPLASLWRQDLGIEVDLEPLESATYESRRLKGEYGALLTTVGAPVLLGTNNFYKSSGLYAKGYGINDPQLDRLIDTAEKEGSLEKRRVLYHDIQRLIIDKLYGILTVEPVGFASWQPWLNNYLMSPGAQVIPYHTPPTTWIDPSLVGEGRRNEKLPF